MTSLTRSNARRAAAASRRPQSHVMLLLATSDSVRPRIAERFRLQALATAAIERRPGIWKSYSSPSGMSALAIVDAGPLYAAADSDDQDHEASVAALSRGDLRLVLPALAIAEATYFVGRRLGPLAESRFMRGLGTFDVEAPTPDDFGRIAELVEAYADSPLGGTDASAVALAERLGAPIIITLDRRHFAAVRPHHRDAFELLP